MTGGLTMAKATYGCKRKKVPVKKTKENLTFGTAKNNWINSLKNTDYYFAALNFLAGLRMYSERETKTQDKWDKWKQTLFVDLDKEFSEYLLFYIEGRGLRFIATQEQAGAMSHFVNYVCNELLELYFWNNSMYETRKLLFAVQLAAEYQNDEEYKREYKKICEEFDRLYSEDKNYKRCFE